MMKKLLFCLFLAICATGTLFAQTFTSGGIKYTVTSPTTVEVGDNYGFAGAVVIPSSVTNESITYSVTSIGDAAFNDGTGLTSVSIPTSVTSIGNNAFKNCIKLTSVTIPSSVLSVGGSAFENCSGLTSLSIPNSVTSISDYTFSGCSNLTSMSIPNSVTSIGNVAFRYCTKLTSVTIPNSVTSIGEIAFAYCTGLTSFIIPNSVTSIGNFAFGDCSSLTSITIPFSVSSIGGQTFFGCTGLTSVKVEWATPLIITANVFENVTLTGVTLNVPAGTVPAYQTASVWKDFGNITEPVVKPVLGDTFVANGINYIITKATLPYEVAVGNNRSFTGEATIPTGVTNAGNSFTVTSIASDAFNGCQSLTAVIVGNSIASIGANAFISCKSLTSIIIPNSVTSVGDAAFSSCSGLTSATIGNSLTSIGTYAFYSCYGLISVNIGNSVLSIGTSAFAYCWGLKSVTLPNLLTSISTSAFEGCRSLTSLTVPNAVTIIGTSAFGGCWGLKSVTIPNTVTSIGVSAFYNCLGLTSVSIPNSVTSIGNYAFGRCSSLTSVSVEWSTPLSVTNNVFDLLDLSAGTLNVPVGTETAYKNALVWKEFGSILEPVGTVIIGTQTWTTTNLDISTYRDGTVIPQVTDPMEWSNLRTGAWCYYENTGSNAVYGKLYNWYAVAGIHDGDPNTPNKTLAPTGYHIPTDVEWTTLTTFLGGENIAGGKMKATSTSLWLSPNNGATNSSGFNGLPNGSRRQDFAFYGIDFNPYLGQTALWWCSNINESTGVPKILRLANEWGDALLNVNNRAGEGFAVRCLLGEPLVAPLLNQTFTVNGINYIVTKATLPYEVAVGDNRNFVGAASIPATVSNTGYSFAVTSIGDDAFNECPGITSVSIPNSITSIGSRAFVWCHSITSLTIPNSVTSIGEYAFGDCSGLTSVTVNWETPLAINANVFGETPIATVVLYVPAGTAALYNAAAVWQDFNPILEPVLAPVLGQTFATNGINYIVTKVTLPYEVAVGSNTSFVGNATIPATVTNTGYSFAVTSIGDDAFNECPGITSVSIPNSITSIGSRAFVWCHGITSLTIPNSVTSIGEYAFGDCSGLTSVTVNWETPLSINRNVFDLLDLSTGTLNVPLGTETAYKNALVWKEFGTITSPSIPPTAIAQTFCGVTTVAGLTATGTAIKWYNVATGGTALATTTAIITGIYYATQTVNSIESARTQVAVTITSAAENVTTQTACNSYTWNGTTYTASGIYTGATANCVTEKLNLTIGAPVAPMGEVNQTFIIGATLADMVTNANTIAWYATLTNADANTNELAFNTILVNGTTYYGVNTLGTCRSSALAVTVSVQPILPLSITSFTPTTTIEGTTVTLTGTNFTDATAVSFGGTVATSFTVNSPTTITAIVGAGASGNVLVTTTAGTSTLGGYTFVPKPTITPTGQTTFAIGGSVLLSANPSTGFSYQWLNNGSNIANANSATYTATVTGNYTVTITANNVSETSASIAVNAIYTLPANNLKITNTSETCRSSNNGKIGIEALQANTYIAQLAGNGLNLTKPFTNTVDFLDLQAGSYKVCVTVSGQTNYSQCFDVTIVQPQDLGVYSVIKADNKVTLTLSGSDLYNVELNGITQQTNLTNLELSLQPGQNILKVSTDKNCQGVIEKQFTVNPKPIIYPNPFEHTVNVYNLPIGKTAVEVQSLDGKVVFKSSYVNKTGTISIELNQLNAGNYILKTSTNNSVYIFKIIKK